MTSIADLIESRAIKDNKPITLNAFQRSVCDLLDAARVLTSKKVPFEIEVERWEQCGLSTLLTLMPFRVLTLNDETVHLSNRWDCTDKIVMLDLQSRIHYNPDVFAAARGVIVFRLRDQQAFDNTKPKISLRYIAQ